MTRGNQRELARAKNAKKQANHKKSANDSEGNKGKKLEDRKQRDAEMMRLKQQKADEKKTAAAAGTSTSGKSK